MKQGSSGRALLRSFRDRDLAKYIDRCLACGFTLTMDGSTHVRLIAPNGDKVSVSTTQYSGKMTHEVISRIRRIGGPR